MTTKATTDIYFAAVLLASGAKLDKTDRSDPRHMVFHFSAPVEKILIGGSPTAVVPKPVMDLDKLETDWVNRTYTINAYDLCEAVKRMKSIVHTQAY